MIECDCQIDDGGFCPRHEVEKSALLVRKCRERGPYFVAFEEGRGPGQRAPKKRKRKRFAYSSDAERLEMVERFIKTVCQETDCELYIGTDTDMCNYTGCSRKPGSQDILKMKNGCPKKKWTLIDS